VSAVGCRTKPTLAINYSQDTADPISTDPRGSWETSEPSASRLV